MQANLQEGGPLPDYPMTLLPSTSAIAPRERHILQNAVDDNSTNFDRPSITDFNKKFAGTLHEKQQAELSNMFISASSGLAAVDINQIANYSSSDLNPAPVSFFIDNDNKDSIFFQPSVTDVDSQPINFPVNASNNSYLVDPSAEQFFAQCLDALRADGVSVPVFQTGDGTMKNIAGLNQVNLNSSLSSNGGVKSLVFPGGAGSATHSSTFPGCLSGTVDSAEGQWITHISPAAQPHRQTSCNAINIVPQQYILPSVVSVPATSFTLTGNAVTGYNLMAILASSAQTANHFTLDSSSIHPRVASHVSAVRSRSTSGSRISTPMYAARQQSFTISEVRGGLTSLGRSESSEGATVTHFRGAEPVKKVTPRSAFLSKSVACLDDRPRCLADTVKDADYERRASTGSLLTGTNPMSVGVSRNNSVKIDKTKKHVTFTIPKVGRTRNLFLFLHYIL